MENKGGLKFDQPSPSLLVVNQYLWILLLATVVVILLLGYLFVLQPKINNIEVSKSTSEEVSAKQVEVDNLVKKVTELNERYDIIQKQRERDLLRLQQVVPADPQIAELFVITERLALDRGFIMSSVDFSNTSEALGDQETSQYPEGLKPMMINMSVSQTIDPDNPPEVDSYSSFKYFLSDLETNLRLFDVQTVSFEGVGVPEATELTFNFTILTYYSDLDKIESSTGLKAPELPKPVVD